MDRLVVVKFHTNIANRWLFMIQRKIMTIIIYSWCYFDMFRGPFFSGHGVDNVHVFVTKELFCLLSMVAVFILCVATLWISRQWVCAVPPCRGRRSRHSLCWRERHRFVRNHFFSAAKSSSWRVYPRFLTLYFVRMTSWWWSLAQREWGSVDGVWLLLLLVWQAPLGVHSAKRRHQSPEWTILSHSYRLIQWAGFIGSSRSPWKSLNLNVPYFEIFAY